MTSTAAEQDELPPIEPLHDRWEPNPIPANIEVPGLDTSAPVQDQIEQIEQLITIRLQVSSICYYLASFSCLRPCPLEY